MACIGCAAGIGLYWACIGLKDRDVTQSMEVFPRNALRISDPVFFALRIAATGFPFIDQCHVCAAGLGFELEQFISRVGLKTQVVQSRPPTTTGNRKVDPWIFEHPFGVVGF